MVKLYDIIKVTENDVVAFTYRFTMGTSPRPMTNTSQFRYRSRHAAKQGFERSVNEMHKGA